MKTCAFIEVLTLDDDQLIKFVWLAAPAIETIGFI